MSQNGNSNGFNQTAPYGQQYPNQPYQQPQYPNQYGQPQYPNQPYQQPQYPNQYGQQYPNQPYQQPFQQQPYQQQPQSFALTIERESNMFAMAMSYTVRFNGRKVGTIKNGSTKTFILPMQEGMVEIVFSTMQFHPVKTSFYIDQNMLAYGGAFCRLETIPNWENSILAGIPGPTADFRVTFG